MARPFSNIYGHWPNREHAYGSSLHFNLRTHAQLKLVIAIDEFEIEN